MKHIYKDDFEILSDSAMVKHLAMKKSNPLTLQEASEKMANLQQEYTQKFDKIKTASFDEKTLILKQLNAQLDDFEEAEKKYKENVFKEVYNTDEFEQTWFYHKILFLLKSLKTNPSLKKEYQECENKFKDLFVNYYFYTKENKIYADSILTCASMNIHDTSWKYEMGKEIKNYELKENDDFYIKITRSEVDVLENFFMQDINLIYSQNIKKALTYAIYYLTGKKRKILDKPYLSHALETLLISASITSDENVLISSLLHGIIKNSDANIIEIKKYFGMEVAEKVLFMTNMEENFKNEKDWSEGKKNILYKLDNATTDIKILVLSNELSKLREIDKDFESYKDKVWSYFNETDKNKHKWYHEEVISRLYTLRFTHAYDEYKELIFKTLTNIFN